MGLKSTKVKYVELPHTDATALPKDVKKGKVFYNNDGRQVGDYEETFDLTTLSEIYGGMAKERIFNKNTTGTDSVSYDCYIGISNTGQLQSGAAGITKVENAFSFYADKLIGIKFQSTLLFAEFDLTGNLNYHNGAFCLKGFPHSNSEIFVIFQKQKIYVKISPTCTETVTVYYI